MIQALIDDQARSAEQAVWRWMGHDHKAMTPSPFGEYPPKLSVIRTHKNHIAREASSVWNEHQNNTHDQNRMITIINPITENIGQKINQTSIIASRIVNQITRL